MVFTINDMFTSNDCSINCLGLHTRSAPYFSTRSLLGTMVQDIISIGNAKSQLKLLTSPRAHHRCKHDSIDIVWSILLRSLRCVMGHMFQLEALSWMRSTRQRPMAHRK